jgi:hypothetical protein
VLRRRNGIGYWILHDAPVRSTNAEDGSHHPAHDRSPPTLLEGQACDRREVASLLCAASRAPRLLPPARAGAGAVAELVAASNDHRTLACRAAGLRIVNANREAASLRSDASGRGASAGRAAGSLRCAIGRRSHDRLCCARCHRSAAIARDDARLPRRSRAPQQGAALSRPTRPPSPHFTTRCAFGRRRRRRWL